MTLHQRKPPFRFYNFWADNNDFDELIKQVWSSHIEGSPMYQVTQKLKLLKTKLKLLNKINYNNLSQNCISKNKIERDLGSAYSISRGPVT